MPDVIDQLRRYGEAVEAAVPVAEVRGPRDRRPFLLVAAALLLVACVGAGVWALRADDPADDNGPVVDTTEGPTVESGWQTLDPGPLEPREGAAAVWTGEELVVWGGYREATGQIVPDGGAYSPASGEWRAMASAPPVAPGRRATGSALGVWTGDEVLLWTTGAGWAGSAWNPATDTWRRLAPGGPSQDYVDDGLNAPVWTGEEMLDAAANRAYDPVTDAWRVLPDRPVEGAVRGSVWTGDEFLVLVANRSDASYPAGEAVALSYNPDDDAWRALPPTGVGETAVALAWDGEQAVALDYDMRAAAYDPDGGRWTQLPDLPMRFYECSPQLVRSGDTVLANHCSGYALLTDDGQWAIAPPAERGVGQLVATDDTLISWSSSDTYGDPPGTMFQSYRAPESAGGDLALERTIPIGTVLLDLPEDARLTSTGLEEEAGGLVTALSFTIRSGDVECRLTSTYAGIQSEVRIRNDASTVDAEISTFPLTQVDIGRDRALIAQWPAGATDDQAHILLEESTSDVLDIACPDLLTANALLERIHR